MKKIKAFTLVELSIVLIVIGLLTGAILKGQEIIRNAKLKRIMSDFSDISTAIYTYEDRFDQFPGDDASSIVALSMEVVGDENGLINEKESKMVFRHLRKAGILSGDAENSKLNHALKGRIYVIKGSKLGSVVKDPSKNILNILGNAICFDNIKAEDALLLDAQNDDGFYDKGALQSNKSYTNSDKLLSVCLKL